MDTWTDVFIDQKGIRRCKRCQHARPEKYQNIGGVALQAVGDVLGNLQKAVSSTKK
jgi:hypothetical protein